MAIEKVSITEIMEKLGIPKDSKYLGYVIHLPNEDEFLAFYQSTKSSVQRGFSRSPESAIKYKSYKKALSHAKSCKQIAEVWLAFNLNHQILVTPVDPDTSIIQKHK